MTRSRLTQFATRTAALGVLLAGCAGVALAQKAKPPLGPPVTTQGAVKSNPNADKGQATAESKRIAARDRKAAKAADKLQNTEQRSALKDARSEPKALLKGIALTKAERKSMKAIEKRYAGEFKVIEQQARIAEKAGQADPSVASRVEDLRMRERAELRAALPLAQQARFDSNVATLGPRKP